MSFARGLRSASRIGLGFAWALVLGCGQQPGLVEMGWQFDDGQLMRIFPQGAQPNVCALPSTGGFDYALQVRLRIVTNSDACVNDPSQDSCQIIEPVVFDCNRFRGTAKDVSVSDPDKTGDDPGYLMFAEVLIQPTNSVEPFVADPSCVQAPGPRIRNVQSGRITDLEVYQFVFSSFLIGGDPVDIEACRTSDTGDGDGDMTTTETGDMTETGTMTETGP